MLEARNWILFEHATRLTCKEGDRVPVGPLLIPPDVQSLQNCHTFNISHIVFLVDTIRPDNVHVKSFYERRPENITLESIPSLNRGENILHWYLLFVCNSIILEEHDVMAMAILERELIFPQFLRNVKRLRNRIRGNVVVKD